MARHRILSGLILLILAVSARGDWPTARGNGGRTGTVPVGPTGPLRPAWKAASAIPAPAWPGEARGSLWQRITNSLTARAADDLAPVPILVGGRVIFATTHDEVRCVDQSNGTVLWRHFCGGPVRYAPVAHEGKVLVGSDDGTVEAIDLESGRVVWATRIGPDQPLVSGNGRPISTCPVRTGLLVADGRVYVAAGLFPLEGTYLVALDPRDGSLRWRRQLGAVSPQGYLVDAGTDILVPCGRASPRLYRKQDGTFVREVPSASGTFAVVSEGETLSGPGPTGTIEAAQARTGAKIVSYPGRQMAVTAERSYLVTGLELVVLDRARLRSSRGDLAKSTLWKAECGTGAALIVAGDQVYVGASDRVEVFDTETGVLRQSLITGSPVAALAANALGLVVALRDGTVIGYQPTTGAGASLPVAVTLGGEANRGPRIGAGGKVEEWVRKLPSPSGWALWSGTGDPLPMVTSLIAAGRLHVVVAATESGAPGLRQRLADLGWLGTHVSVVIRRADGSLPVTDHLFNLVLADGLSAAEAVRLACPAPSGWIVRGGVMEAAPAGARTGSWTHQYGNAANTCATAQPLTGYPRLQWFGGHGPERMPDRHTRGHAPLAAGGLLLSMAENGLIATDARNGTVRWELDLPDSMRYAMPYDAGYAALSEDGLRAYVAVKSELWVIDARQGVVERRIPCPMPDRHWGWVAVEGGMIHGSAQLPTASRTLRQFELVDLDYRSERPLVGSAAVFRMDPATGATLWMTKTEGAFVNATLCRAGDRIYAVEARGVRAREDRLGRLDCSAYLEDAHVVCRDAGTGRPVWERPLQWSEARDILGLTVAGDHLFLSAAQSIDQHAVYHLRCWSSKDGTELWKADGRNPGRDLYHGQQVKRPVVLRDRVAFEVAIYEIATGKAWVPPGQLEGWAMSRPGHACGGMTGADDGLLFRADNPTFFRIADGTFTRLSPTRPGCWLNILPAEGGVLIPEASASCVCGYPLQTSMGFGFGVEPVPRLPDVGM